MTKKKKKIAIVSMRYDYEKLDEDDNTLRFYEEANDLGYDTKLFFANKFFVSFEKKKINIFYNEKKLNMKQFDLVIPITGGKKNNRILIEILERMNLNVKNNLSAVELAKNKIRTLACLVQKGLPTIPTAMNFSEYWLGPLLDFFPEDEYICKITNRSLGKGVSYINNKLSLISNFELFAAGGIQPSNLMFERFIKESSGRDIRVIATKKKVIVAMQRYSNGFDFRANISGGGKGEIVKLTPKMKKMAIDAVKALGLDYGGVDLIESDKGPLIIEVNANPGTKIEQITETKVVREIIKELIK